MDNIEDKVKGLSQRAVQYGKSFNKNLDFSEESLKEVEEILEYYHKDLKGSLIKNILRKVKKEDPTSSQVWSMATIWGVYLGEVICRNNVGRCCWVYEGAFNTEPTLHLNVDNNNRAYPIDKVYKRLKNGIEDNIISFYDVFKKMVLTNEISNR